MKKIAIIIATYNRAESLLVTLRSVVQQSLDPAQWECVVVNNNSSDDTLQRAKEFAADYPHLDISVVTESRQGLSWARNCGIEHSTAEIVAIIDDDETINPEFAAAYVELFATQPQVASAGGRIIAKYLSGRPRWMSHYTELPIANPINLGTAPRPFPAGRIPGGGNMAIRRSALERHGAFDVELGRQGAKLIGGEESDLFARLARAGEQCWYCPNAIMWHLIPAEKLTKEYFDRLTYNIGVSQLLREQGGLAKIALRELGKWIATLGIAVIYLLQCNPQKSAYLLRMRFNISSGIFGDKE